MEEKYEIKKYTKCNKCGELYDANYRRCPKCNHSNFLDILIRIVFALLIVATLVVSSICLYKVNKLEEAINNINIEETTSDDTLDLTAQSYYATYELTDDNFDSVTEQFGDYIIYFHQYDCPHCEQANVFINQYVTLGYSGYLPVVFTTPDNGQGLFEKYGIESTPSAIYVKDGNIVETREGSDEVFELFDNIVAQASEGE